MMVEELLWSLDRTKYGDRIFVIGQPNIMISYQTVLGGTERVYTYVTAFRVAAEVCGP